MDIDRPNQNPPSKQNFARAVLHMFKGQLLWPKYALFVNMTGDLPKSAPRLMECECRLIYCC